jgi:hypothetical protein
MNPRDEERDAWLAQALRHAPDADADAPPALSDVILREARAAAVQLAAPGAPPTSSDIGLLQWLASAWDWLARPPVAAGFASVMVATLVGVMWWDKPAGDTLPGAPEVVSSAPQAQAEAAPAAAVAAAPAAPGVQTTPAESAAPKPAEASRESAARGRLAEKKEAEQSARAARPTDTPPRLRDAAEAAPAVAAAAPPPVAFPAAPTAPPPKAAATANEAASALAERRELVAPAAKMAAESSAQATADKAGPPRNDLRALQGSASPALAKSRGADAGTAPLAALRAQIAQQPERWRWQRGTGAPQPMNAAVQGWLTELDRQSASRWQAGDGNTAREPANTLRLYRDGVLQATLGFTSAAAWAEAAGASTPAASFAPLPDGTAESLRKALDDATL